MCAAGASVDLECQVIHWGIHRCVPCQGDEQNSAHLAGLLVPFGFGVLASAVVMV